MCTFVHGVFVYSVCNLVYVYVSSVCVCLPVCVSVCSVRACHCVYYAASMHGML